MTGWLIPPDSKGGINQPETTNDWVGDWTVWIPIESFKHKFWKVPFLVGFLPGFYGLGGISVSHQFMLQTEKKTARF